MRSTCLIGSNWPVSDRHYGKERIFAQIGVEASDRPLGLLRGGSGVADTCQSWKTTHRVVQRSLSNRGAEATPPTSPAPAQFPELYKLITRSPLHFDAIYKAH